MLNAPVTTYLGFGHWQCRKRRDEVRSTSRRGGRRSERTEASNRNEDFMHCGFERKASESYTLAVSAEWSHIYTEQTLYVLHCRACGRDFYRWMGTGDKGCGPIHHLTAKQFHNDWAPRLKTEKILRCIQNPRSEWCKKVARPADQALHYLKQLEAAQLILHESVRIKEFIHG